MPEYDYSSPALYFVTMVTNEREFIFGTVVNGIMQLNEYGLFVEKYWHELPNHFPNVILNEYIVMPNHFHGIIELTDVGARFIAPDQTVIAPIINREKNGGVTKEKNPMGKGTLGEIIRWLKGRTTFEINQINHIQLGAINRAPTSRRIWQRSFHDHIIRDEGDLFRIQQYIVDNPLNWQNDELFH